MTTRFLIGAFAALVILTLLIFWILQGGLFKPSTSKPSTNTKLPSVSDKAVSTRSAYPLVTPPPAIQVQTYTNTELGLTFSYPKNYEINTIKKSPTSSFPFLAYEFVFKSAQNLGDFSFGVFLAPHPEAGSLADILNAENEDAKANSQTPSSFTIINPLGNSQESARITSNSPSLYALRARSDVYYVYPVAQSGGHHNPIPLIDQIVASFTFSAGK